MWNKFRKNGRLVIDGSKGKGKVIPLEARCGPKCGYSYSSTLSRTSVLEGGEWSASRPGRLYPRERPGTHFTGGWMGPRAGLDGRKICSHRESIPDRPARSSVAVPTELPDPQLTEVSALKHGTV